MKRLILSGFLFFSLFSFQTLMAQTERLQERVIIKIISEPENNKSHDFSLMVDGNGDIVELMRKSGNDVQKFSLEELVGKDQVLLRAEGRDVIILQCPNCDAVHGGDVGIKYMRNGLSMTYKVFKMVLRRSGDTWKAFTIKNEKINSLRIKSRILFGQLVGIKKIEVNK